MPVSPHSSSSTTARALIISLSIVLPTTLLVATMLFFRHRHRKPRAHLIRYPVVVGREVNCHKPLGLRLIDWLEKLRAGRERKRERREDAKYAEAVIYNRKVKEEEHGRALDMKSLLGLVDATDCVFPVDVAERGSEPDPFVLLETGTRKGQNEWLVLDGNSLGSQEELQYRIVIQLPTFPLRVANPQRSRPHRCNIESQTSAGASEYAENSHEDLSGPVASAAPPRLPTLGSLRDFDMNFDSIAPGPQSKTSSTPRLGACSDSDTRLPSPPPDILAEWCDFTSTATPSAEVSPAPTDEEKHGTPDNQLRWYDGTCLRSVHAMSPRAYAYLSPATQGIDCSKSSSSGTSSLADDSSARCLSALCHLTLQLPIDQSNDEHLASDRTLTRNDESLRISHTAAYDEFERLLAESPFTPSFRRSLAVTSDDVFPKQPYPLTTHRSTLQLPIDESNDIYRPSKRASMRREHIMTISHIDARDEINRMLENTPFTPSFRASMALVADDVFRERQCPSTTRRSTLQLPVPKSDGTHRPSKRASMRREHIKTVSHIDAREEIKRMLENTPFTPSFRMSLQGIADDVFRERQDKSWARSSVLVQSQGLGEALKLFGSLDE